VGRTSARFSRTVSRFSAKLTIEPLTTWLKMVIARSAM
jgi:hypothetical protein